MTEFRQELGDGFRSVRWQEVLDEWRASEEKQWEPVFRERGFASWWEWRQSYLEELEVGKREWKEERVDRPHTVIPGLVIGGYRGWKQYRPVGKDTATFADVARPVAEGERSYAGTPRVDIRTNTKVMELVGHLRDTSILVLRCPSLQVVLEGAHRCAATSVEAVDVGSRSKFSARLRFCEFDETERPLLEAFARDRQIRTKS